MGMFDEFVGGQPDPAYVEPPPRVVAPTVMVPNAPAARPGLFDEYVGGAPTQVPVAKSDIDWSSFNKPQGELKAADPSWTQAAKWAGQDVLMQAGMQPYTAGKLSDALLNVGSTVVPPMGTVLSGADLTYDASRGNVGRAAMDAIGAIPGVVAARRFAQGVRGALPTIVTADVPTRTVDQTTGRVTDELLDASRNAYDRVAQAPIEYHPNAIADYAQRARYYLQQPGARGVFTPESAPGVFGLLDRYPAEFARNQRGPGPLPPGTTNLGRTVTAQDFDILRQQLRSFDSGADSAAGQRAAAILENYMYNPPPGAILRMRPGAMDTLRADMDAARGDWRAGKTAATVEKEIDRAGTKAGGAGSGLNIDNQTRQRLSALTTTDAGEAKIFGALYPEKQAINAVVAGDPVTNKLRYIGNRMGGGGGFTGTFGGGIAGHTLNSLLGSWGVDPITATAVGAATGYAWPKVGEAFRRAANDRTVRAAEDVVDQIRKNSPLYRAREAASPDMIDPRAMTRDAVAYAMLPQVAQQGRNVWDQMHVPYDNREE